MLRGRMQDRPGIPRRGAAAIVFAIAMIGMSATGAGCSVLLAPGDNPQKCRTDADCARFPNAACDGVRKLCVPRLPYAGDSGAPLGTGGSLACELSFDNAARITMPGPDGGLRPLPEDPAP